MIHVRSWWMTGPGCQRSAIWAMKCNDQNWSTQSRLDMISALEWFLVKFLSHHESFHIDPPPTMPQPQVPAQPWQGPFVIPLIPPQARAGPAPQPPFVTVCACFSSTTIPNLHSSAPAPAPEYHASMWEPWLLLLLSCHLLASCRAHFQNL